MRLLLISALASGLFATSAEAAEAWRLHEAVGASEALKLSGSIRARHEVLDGQFRPGANPTDELALTRLILTGEYDTGNLRFGAELYDSRAFGGKVGGAISTGEVNALEFVQAYVAGDFDAPFGAGSTAGFQAGRFMLNLGSRRLVAADDYRNTTNGYTGLRLDARLHGGANATAIYVMPQVRLPDDLPSILDNEVKLDRESSDLVLWGAIAARPGLPGRMMAEVSFFGLDEHDAPGRPTRDRALRTVGARVIRDPRRGQFDFEAEAIYQFGSILSGLQPAATALDVSATFFHLDGGYQFAGAWAPRISVEYDRASGDDGKASFGRFDALFGMRRADFAPASLYGALARTNIETPGVRVEVTPSARLDAFVTYRALWLASRTDAFSATGVRDATGRSGRYAGQQVEGRVRYWLVPDQIRLEVNGAILLKGGVLETAPNASRTGDTHYISTAVSAFF